MLRDTAPLEDVLDENAIRVQEAAIASALTDAGNAEFFVATYGDFVRFDHARQRWLIWDSHRWRTDNDGAIHRMALESLRLRTREVVTSDLNWDARQRFAKWLIGSESAARLMALVTIASRLKPIADDGEGWDETPGLLGVP